MLQKPHCDWCAKSSFDNNNNNNNNENENDIGNENENNIGNDNENENKNDINFTAEKGGEGEVLPSLRCRTGKILQELDLITCSI